MFLYCMAGKERYEFPRSSFELSLECIYMRIHSFGLRLEYIVMKHLQSHEKRSALGLGH